MHDNGSLTFSGHALKGLQDTPGLSLTFYHRKVTGNTLITRFSTHRKSLPVNSFLLS